MLRNACALCPQVDEGSAPVHRHPASSHLHELGSAVAQANHRCLAGRVGVRGAHDKSCSGRISPRADAPTLPTSAHVASMIAAKIKGGRSEERPPCDSTRDRLLVTDLIVFCKGGAST